MENISRRRPKNCEIAYKVLMRTPYGLKTPCMLITVDTTKPLVAEGSPEFLPRWGSNFFTEIFGHKNLHGGAIHCFRTLEDAGRYLFEGEAIFKVRGTGYICHNDTQIAFKEIEFLEEV